MSNDQKDPRAVLAEDLERRARAMLGPDGLDELVEAANLAEAALELTGAVQGLLAEVALARERADRLDRANGKLQELIAGGAELVEEGTTLDDQRRLLDQALREVARLNGEVRTLMGVIPVWSEGKKVVIHVRNEQRPLIEVAREIPS